MTELQPSERPAYSPVPGWLTAGSELRIGYLLTALSHGALWFAVCRPSNEAESRRPTKSKRGERHRLFSSRRRTRPPSPVSLLHWLGAAEPWESRQMQGHLLAVSSGWQECPPPPKSSQKKGEKNPPPPPPTPPPNPPTHLLPGDANPRRQATDTRLAEWRQPRAIFRNVGQNLTHARRGLAGRTSKQIADGRASREEFMWWGMNQRERKDNLFYSRIMDENKQRHILSRARLEHLCHPRPTSGVTYRARGHRCSKGPLIILMMIWKCLSLCWWNI